MDKYISHYTAASFWNIPYIDAVLDSEFHDTDKMDVTVFKRNARLNVKHQVTHLSLFTLPEGAVVLRDGEMVSSPELLFLQLESKLNIHREILLGLQLCSHPPGDFKAAVTTKQRLRDFIEKIPGHRGHRNALRALKYVENGSASIMESMVYMILTLPHILGGYGLKGANFNYEINLKDGNAVRLGQKRCFVDLYYKAEKVAVEYDSFAFHNSPVAQGKDAVRSAMLERQGIDMMRLSTIQLYSKEACMDFVLNLASRLEKRIQIRTDKFNRMHARLRTLLPTGDTQDA